MNDILSNEEIKYYHNLIEITKENEEYQCYFCKFFVFKPVYCFHCKDFVSCKNCFEEYKL